MESTQQKTRYKVVHLKFIYCQPMLLPTNLISTLEKREKEPVTKIIWVGALVGVAKMSVARTPGVRLPKSNGKGTLRCKSWRQGRGQDMTYRAVTGGGHREAWGQQQNIREVPADQGKKWWQM